MLSPTPHYQQIHRRGLGKHCAKVHELFKSSNKTRTWVFSVFLLIDFPGRIGNGNVLGEQSDDGNVLSKYS